MPSALVVNASTSRAMSAGIGRTAEAVFCAPWTFEVVSAPAGPESLESWRDCALAAVTALSRLLETWESGDRP